MERADSVLEGPFNVICDRVVAGPQPVCVGATQYRPVPKQPGVMRLKPPTSGLEITSVEARSTANRCRAVA